MTDTPSEGLAQFDALVAGSWRNGGSRGLAEWRIPGPGDNGRAQPRAAIAALPGRMRP
jgi:hypothetical protein